MAFHKNESLGTLHSVHFRTYANAALRLADVTIVAADIGKVVLQSDTNQYYIIQNHSPVQYASITGSGAGSGGINYISDNNSNAADSVGDWIAYNDADAVPLSRPGGATPGSGGVPTVTIARSTLNPLRGSSNFLVTKTAVNSQGQGVSIPFTIDNADKTKLLTISLDYNGSAGFVAGSDLVDSDLEVYIYDVTNNLVIQPSTYKLTTSATFNGSFTGTFQAASNSTSYRLILHVATTNALAWTFQFDNVRVGPGTTVPLQTIVTDWQSYTPTVGGLGAGSVTGLAGKWRRIGDSMEIDATFDVAVAGSGASNVFISLPTGYSIDSTKLSGPSYARNAPGYTSRNTTTTLTFLSRDANDTTLVTVFAGANLSTLGERFAFKAMVPILGWASNITISNVNTDASVIVAKGQFSGSTAIGVGATKIQLSTIVYDTNGMINLGLERFTIPVSGYYRISGYVRLDGASDDSKRPSYDIYKGVGGGAPVFFERVSSTGFRAPLDGTQLESRFDTIIQFNAGDTFELYGTMNFGGATNYQTAEIVAQRIPASAVVIPSGSGIPAGVVHEYAGTTAPSGYLMCDGSSLDRVIYANLFAAIGTAHGAPSGSTFNLPDYRGRFLRGSDNMGTVAGAAGRDPNAGTRTAAQAGGNAGNLVGSVQVQGTKLPTTPFTTGTESAPHTHKMYIRSVGSTVNPGPNGSLVFSPADGSADNSGTESANHTHTATGGGDNDTRPINAYVNYIIKI